MLRVKRVASMHCAGVIPHHRITRLPLVRIDKFRARSPLKQKFQHLFTLRGIPANDFSCHAGAQIECFSIGHGMRSDNRVMDVGGSRFLRVISGHAVGAVKRFVGLIRETPVEFCSGSRGERFPSRAHVCEFGITAFWWQCVCHQQ